jgi:transketolase
MNQDQKEFETVEHTTVDRAADTIRILAAAMVEKAKSGHPGGAMGGADFINILYSEFLKYDPDDASWFSRDRFFLDPGHMSAMLYSQLALCGFFSLDDLKNFRQWRSVTPGHPERCVSRGIENTSGPLGQGHAMALGSAIAERFLAARFGNVVSHRTYAYISDGGIQEEISQGVGRLAGHLGLSRFIMFYDSNDIQLSSTTSDVTSEDTAKKYEAWGWNVLVINGNDQHQIRDALRNANAEEKRPTLIIGKTVMGKGARDANHGSFERKVSTHGMPLSEAGGSFEKTLQNLGADPANPFTVFPDVAEYYSRIREQKAKTARAEKENQAVWTKSNPDSAQKLENFIKGVVPPLNWDAIPIKAGAATRASSGIILGEFARKIDNMIVSSADLSNSDKTDGFLKGTKILAKDDFSGAFLQAGVSEFTMAAVMNGLAAHGGVIPVCATFFTFSDFMKPAIRLAALMGLGVKYVFTHDSFRVGEDGPTHQPVEQEAQLRLLEQMTNLEGKRSMLVLRPADGAETVSAWKLALEQHESPCALLLTRQNVPDLPPRSGSTRLRDAESLRKGAYIVLEATKKPELICLANGSEVGTLVEAIALVEKRKNASVRLVSIPSIALFKEQPQEYKDSVLAAGVPVFALTAGLPSTFAGLTGALGKVVGLERFGASAPYKVLDEKFGFTPMQVAERIVEFISGLPALVDSLRKTIA